MFLYECMIISIYHHLHTYHSCDNINFIYTGHKHGWKYGHKYHGKYGYHKGKHYGKYVYKHSGNYKRYHAFQIFHRRFSYHGIGKTDCDSKILQIYTKVMHPISILMF